ncbi:MAG: AAA family ATPase, partial [Candidatus Dojkabacteria bacterium]
SKHKRIPIDINKIKLPAEIKELIHQGEEIGKRSESIMKVMISLVGNGFSYEKIYEMFEQFPIGEKMREKGAAGNRYLRREYETALKYVEENGIVFESEKYQQLNSNAISSLSATSSLEVENIDDNLEWIIEDFWAKGSPLAIIGDSGAGKSTFALNIFYNLISPIKSKFLETFNITSGDYKTLILNGENSSGSLKKRITSISKHFSVSDDLKEKVSFVKDEKQSIILSAKITNETFLDELERLIISGGFNILCIDPFSCFNPADENSNSEVRNVLDRIGTFARDLNLSLLVLHHTPKNLNSAKQMSGRGAGSFENWAHTEIGIFKKPNKHRILTCKKSRDAEEFADINLLFNSDYVFLPLDKSAINVSNLVVDAIKNLKSLGTQHIIQKDVCDEIARLYEQSNKDTCSFTKARRILLEAQAKNLIKKDSTTKSYFTV